jgi:hypothetical protein
MERKDMASFDELYEQVKVLMQGEADDHGGIITKPSARWIIMKQCNVTHRDSINSKINALIAFKVLIPANKTSYRWHPNGKKNDSDGERIAIDNELQRITGKGKL